MRRNVRHLSWILWLVIIAFIAFYIPALVQGPSNIVARVDGDPITVTEYQRALQQQAAYYQQASGGELPDDFLQQIQLGEMVLQQLIRERLILAAARDQGLTVSAREISERITQDPVFQRNGAFIGPEAYKALLRANGLQAEDFESQVADQILFEKFTDLVSNGVTVTDREVEEEYQRANEQVQFDFFVVRATGLESQVGMQLTEEAARTLFEENIADYRVPEQRQVAYAVIDTEQIRSTVTLSEEELRAAYQADIDEFTVPEQVRARHILFRLPPDPTEEQVAEARAQAEDVLAQLRAGADFAELAEANSDDTASAAAGGDLGWFGRGRMAPEFEDAAFSLDVDTVSDIVQTSFGLHIIRVEGKRPAQVRPFEEVRPQLEQRLSFERAEQIADDRAEELRVAVLRRADLEELAEQFDLQILESPLFTQTAGFSEISSPEFTRQVFASGRNRVSEPIRFSGGWVIFRVDDIVEAHDPQFEEVREQVRADLIRQLAEERAAQLAEEFGTRLSQGEPFNVLAQEIGAPIRSTEVIPRNGVVPELGREPALVMAAFDHDQGEAGGPVEVGPGYALFRVTSHVQPDWSQFAAQRDALRNQLLNQRRSSLFEAMVRELREAYPVVTYDEVRAAVTG
ncbi:MAG: peptidyl-prolyl cis-trans isomerase [Acidobacteriota bacterium]|jgi:peptidyl-prolyl cis-trans isomerase D